MTSELFGDPQSGTWQEFVEKEVSRFYGPRSQSSSLRRAGFRLCGGKAGAHCEMWVLAAGSWVVRVGSQQPSRAKAREADRQERGKKSRTFVQGDFVDDQS